MAGTSAHDRMEAAGRSVTALVIRRPILAFVVNALIVLAGLAALRGVEVRELPEVDRPVISVTTDFDGASPETIDREITARIEGAVSRVQGVSSISSSSRFGSSRVTVEFRDDVNLDTAATDVRDAVARLANVLPDGADPPRTVKAGANGDIVMRISVTSPFRTAQELTEIVRDRIEDRLIAAPGVADVQVNGDRAEVFRVDVNQLQLASRGLTLADVVTALRDVSFDSPAGSLSTTEQSILVRATAALATVEDFEDLNVAPDVRLADVALVTLGPEDGTSILRANGQNGVGLGIVRQAQSNTLEISEAVTRIVDELQGTLPQDVRIFVSYDSATFINGAIHEVEIALALSVAIVALIIFAFLGDLRATLIPLVAIPVSLVGTIAAIWLVGFSVNILTLLALVLATGIVVDDAIVVLENIVRRRSEGMGARAAAVLGTEQVFFAVLATTTTLAAVFVPLSFLPGETGGLFREFGFTLAISVLLSSVTALSLCPVLASRMLKAAESTGRTRTTVKDRLGSFLSRVYAFTLRAVLRAPYVAFSVAVLFSATAAILYPQVRQELTPPEDRSVIFLNVQAPQSVALDYTDEKMREIEDLLAPFQDAGEIRNIFAIAGTGADNRGFMVLSLAPWQDRSRGQQEIADELRGKLRGIVGVNAYVSQPNSLGIRGAGSGLTFAVTGDEYGALAAEAGRLVDRMKEAPEYAEVYLGYDTTQAQLFVEVDRTRAADLGVDITGMGEALRAVLDGSRVGTVFRGDKSFDIKLLSSALAVNDPGDLERILVRTASGEMIPVSSFVRLEERAVAPELRREGQMRAVPIDAELGPDTSLNRAYAEALGLAREVLPERYGVVPLGQAKTLEESGSALFITFGFAILIVLLVLAAQFESFVSAFVIMITVPVGLACAVFALLITGGSLNVYSQIGLILLVGIMAKNGILIVEFANQLRDEGMSVRAAIEQASIVRLRPVMMTMIATVLGGVPLVLASGAGAEAREVLGWIIVGGLGMATIATLYLTPVAYLLLAGLSKPRAEEGAQLGRELREASSPRETA